MQTNMCYIIIYVAEAVILWQYTHQIFISRFHILPEMILLFISYAALFGLNLFQISWLNMFSFFMINLLFIRFSYKTSLLSALIHTAVITVAMSIGELIVLNSLFNISFDFYAHLYSFRNLIVATIFNKLIYFFILQFIFHFLTKKKKSGKQSDIGIIMLVISSIISLFFILTLISICENVNYSGSLDWMITLSVILMLILNLLIFGFYNYSQKKNEEFTALQLQLQKEEYNVQYQKMLLQEDENQKILIHDIRNHLQTISTLNNNGESKKLSSYITEIVNSSDLQTTARVSDNDLLNSILGRYIRQCRDNHTSFHIDIRKNSINFLSDKDITSLFCNLLDNAMEAATPLPSSFIDLSVIYKKDLSMTVITLINSCRSDPFSGKGDRLISTKADPGRHGFGLKSIKNITDKYNGETNTYYDKKNKTFHTILTLYYNNL